MKLEAIQILKKEGLLTPIGYYIASQLLIEILQSVQYLYDIDIIHRDLNPYNIMLNNESKRKTFIRVVDFGLMAIHEYADQAHSSNKGNIDYIAPEVFDENNYNTKADIYSLGVILSQLFDINIQE
jgi:serine/threonine protein kinase